MRSQIPEGRLMACDQRQRDAGDWGLIADIASSLLSPQCLENQLLLPGADFQPVCLLLTFTPLVYSPLSSQRASKSMSQLAPPLCSISCCSSDFTQREAKVPLASHSVLSGPRWSTLGHVLTVPVILIPWAYLLWDPFPACSILFSKKPFLYCLLTLSKHSILHEFLPHTSHLLPYYLLQLVISSSLARMTLRTAPDR